MSQHMSEPRVDDPFARRLRNIALVVGGIGILMIAFGIVGRIDFQEELRTEAAREERAASLAASYCLPRPGQRTVWEWKGESDAARLRCVVFDNIGYGRAPRVVMDAEPAGLDRLALFRRGAEE